MILLSIITINYNNAIGLKKTIKSVINQNTKNFEFIIIDGGSVDESVSIIKENCKSIKYWVSEKDNGIYDAMNKGIMKADGKFLMFLNSGDCLSNENILEICIKSIDENIGVDIFYGDIYVINHRFAAPLLHTHPPDIDLIFWKETNINHQSALIKANLFKEFGLYPDIYKLAGDHWIFFKSYLAEKIFFHIAIPLIMYDHGGVSVTARSRYDAEMKDMWKKFLPKYSQDLVIDHQEAKFYLSWRSVKAAIKLHKKFIAIKNIIIKGSKKKQ